MESRTGGQYKGAFKICLTIGKDRKGDGQWIILLHAWKLDRCKKEKLGNKLSAEEWVLF